MLLDESALSAAMAALPSGLSDFDRMETVQESGLIDSMDEMRARVEAAADG